MAYKKNKTLENLRLFAQILYGAKFVRFIFFFYSFVSFIFWFLNCFEADWLYLFNWLFVVPYKFVSNFYTPQGLSVDFSLAIIGAISLFVGLILDFVVNSMYEKVLDLKEAEEKKIKMKRMKERNNMKKRSVVQAQDSSVVNIEENPKLLFLILVHVNKIKKKQSDLELTFQEVEIWKQRVYKKLLDNILYSKPMQKGFYRKNLFLMYKDFFYVDDFLYYIKPTLDSISLEFKKYGVAVSYSYVLSSLSNVEVLEKELDCMDTILSLYFVNEPIVTNRFKITYDNKPTHMYNVKFKGEYNLSKNLSVSNQQPLFSLTEKGRE